MCCVGGQLSDLGIAILSLFEIHKRAEIQFKSSVIIANTTFCSMTEHAII